MRPFTNDARCRQWVDSVLNKMSLKERIGQLFIYTIAPQQDKANRDLLRKVVDDYKVGGLLFSGGLMENQVALTNEAQKMADIPLMITFDGEWGLSMRLRGTPVFPRNMVLGCIQNDSLLYEYGREMARQCRELGVQVNFAPVADVNINPKNPVINTRSFGESPVNVADKVIAYARGLEDGGVLSVSKHFPGHGDTDVDSHHSLPKLSFSRARLDSVELYPFRKAIQAGLSGMMVGHLEVPVLEPKRGVPSSLSRKVVHDLLTQEMQFKGLVFTDALAMKGVSANNTSICLQALQAGHDLLLVPRRIKEEVEAILDAVKKGNPNKVDSSNLCGVKVAVQTGTTQEEEVNKANEQCKADGKDAIDIQSSKLQTDVTTAVASGKADIFYADTPVAGYAIKQTGDTLEALGEDVGVTPEAVAVKKGDSKTAEAVQKAIQKLMDDGTYKKILDTWGVSSGAVDKAEINPSVE